MNKFKVGDVVRIKSGNCSNNKLYFSPEMKKHEGETFTISRITDNGKWYSYRSWAWCDEWLDLVETEGWDYAAPITFNYAEAMDKAMMRYYTSWDFGYAEEITKPKKSIMQKVSVMMKKLLDADTQTLVKAGYINGDLDLTEKGKAAMFAALFDANKAALVVDARAEIDAEAAAK